MENDKGGFTPARTLNEVNDAARFPIIEATPDGNFLIAWIDRRIDNPKPRQLYLMKMGADGRALTKNYQAGEGLCECCKLGLVFADGGKTVYMVDREGCEIWPPEFQPLKSKAIVCLEENKARS